MAVAFRQEQKNIPILFFNPNSWPHRSAKSKYLLWPAYAFRIVAPIPKPKKLNLFQQYILALIQTNLTNPSEIADCLGLEKELVQYILEQLFCMELIDNQGLLTKLGKNLLKDGIFQQQEVKSGYIFQNPLDGKFWPRFVTQLEFADAEYDDKQRVNLLLGNSNTPWRERAFRLLENKIENKNRLFTPPQLEEIIQVYQQHWQDYRQFRQARYNENIPLPNLTDSTISDGQIGLLSSHPIPCLLTTYTYIHSSKSQNGNAWQIADPFGLGTNPSLQKVLEKYYTIDENLQVFLQDLKEDISKIEQETIAANPSEIQEKIIEKFGKTILEHEKLFWKLQSLEIAKIELQKLGSSIFPNNFKDIIFKANAVIKELFQIVQENFSTINCWVGQGLINYDNEHNANMLDKIAKKIGFELDETDKLPNNLRYVKFFSIQQTSMLNNNESLSCLTIILLLKAHRTLEHPFHKLALLYPNFLMFVSQCIELEELVSLNDISKISLSSVLEEIESIYQFLPILIRIK